MEDGFENVGNANKSCNFDKNIIHFLIRMIVKPRTSKESKLGEKGQVVIPAEFRSALDLKPGDQVMMILEGTSVRLTTRAALVKRLRGVFKSDDGRNITDEFLAERRAEAERKWL